MVLDTSQRSSRANLYIDRTSSSVCYKHLRIQLIPLIFAYKYLSYNQCGNKRRKPAGKVGTPRLHYDLVRGGQRLNPMNPSYHSSQYYEGRCTTFFLIFLFILFFNQTQKYTNIAQECAAEPDQPVLIFFSERIFVLLRNFFIEMLYGHDVLFYV